MALGQNLALLPGGFHEAALFTHGKYKCFVKKRMGFIKYSLQYGYKIRPVFCFGEERTFWTCNWFEGFRMKLAAMNMPPVIFGSLWGILPFPNIDIAVVVGEPLVLPRIENPSKEEVAKWHGVYVERLEKLFKENRGKYAVEGEEAVLELQ